MSVNVFTFLVLGAGLLANEVTCITLAVVFSVFGATSAVGLPALGGASITPALLFLPFLVLHALFSRMRTHEPLKLSHPGVLLAALVVWGAISAIVLPRLYAGQTQVIVLDRLTARGARMYPLRHFPTNITQTVYAFGHLACFLSLRTLLRAPRRLLTFQHAVLLVAGLDVAGGLINLLEAVLHTPSLLDYVRNAQGYSLAIEYNLGGLPRLHGTFPEASLFAYYSLPLFAFCLSLWTARAETRVTPFLTCLLLLMLVLSTSATAYLGLFGYGLWYGVRELPRNRVPPILALFAASAVVAVLGLYALDLDATRSLDRFVHATLLDKADSGSGQERALWNAQAFRNFLDTHAIGVGLGSARASSFVLVLLSNLGVLGVLLFGLFSYQVCRAPYLKRDRCSAPEDAVRKAASDATIATLIGSTVAVGMFDLGVSFYMFAAAASTVCRPARAEETVLELRHA